jgi:hypothetical protein
MTIEIDQWDFTQPHDDEIARGMSFDGRICILRSKTPEAVAAWVNNRIGGPPPKPMLADDQIVTTNNLSVGSVSEGVVSGSQGSGNTQDSGPHNDRLIKMWEDNMQAWKDFQTRVQADGQAVLGNQAKSAG